LCWCTAANERRRIHIGQKLSGLEMKRSLRAALLNLGIATGLAIEWHRGVTPLVLVTSGFFLFLMANLLLFVKLGKRRA
jgi:hypothetical protein